MIDTVAFRQEWALPNKHPQGIQTLDKKSDLRAMFKNKRVEWIECSLPKLLFGTNEKLIQTPQEISAAFQKIEAILKFHGTPLQQNAKRFTRVDLVWQFDRNPLEFITAHLYCDHPAIRSETALYRNKYRTTGITWGSPRASMKIKFYDKTNRDISPTREVLRAEIQLRQPKLRDVLNNSQEVANLDLHTCYAAYRSILLQLQKEPVSTASFNTKQEAHFYLHELGAFERLTEKLQSDRQIKDLRKTVTSYAQNLYRIDWEELLPADSLPPYVEPGKRKCPVRIPVKSKSP